jgi:hypothetical protein
MVGVIGSSPFCVPIAQGRTGLAFFDITPKNFEDSFLGVMQMARPAVDAHACLAMAGIKFRNA